MCGARNNGRTRSCHDKVRLSRIADHVQLQRALTKRVVWRRMFVGRVYIEISRMMSHFAVSTDSNVV